MVLLEDHRVTVSSQEFWPPMLLRAPMISLAGGGLLPKFGARGVALMPATPKPLRVSSSLGTWKPTGVVVVLETTVTVPGPAVTAALTSGRPRPARLPP